MNVLAKRLRQLRDAHALSQGQVAVYVGVAQTSYSALERGVVHPKTIDAITALARFYEVSADYLLGLTDDPTPVGRAEAAPPLAAEMLHTMRRLGPAHSRRLLVMAQALADDEEAQREAAHIEQRVNQIADVLGDDAFEKVMEALLVAARTGDEATLRTVLDAALAQTAQQDPVEQG